MYLEGHYRTTYPVQYMSNQDMAYRAYFGWHRVIKLKYLPCEWNTIIVDLLMSMFLCAFLCFSVLWYCRVFEYRHSYDWKYLKFENSEV